MRVLMLGWEFPPHFSGGLGIVCFELTKALSAKGVKTTYVMPSGPDHIKADFVDLVIANKLLDDPNIKLKKVTSLITPYVTSEKYEEWLKHMKGRKGINSPSLYASNLFEEVQRFALLIEIIAERNDFDIIHAHDWLTYLAGIKVKEMTGKPLVVHVHATEFDRSGDGGVNQFVYDVEREGMHCADTVIAVSEKIKNRCIYQYGVPAEKVRVVYNAVSIQDRGRGTFDISPTDKVVLFLGRITLQKGPEYFIDAARKVLDVDPNVKFIMAGSGDMLPRMIHRAAEAGMAKQVLFPGFVNRDQAQQLFNAADVFVMPSVSEPFGLVPLEAMSQDTPVIISKQSGVAEVLKNCIKIDFWDINKMAENILAVLHYKELHRTLKEHGSMEMLKFNWDKPASQVLGIYQQLLQRCHT